VPVCAAAFVSSWLAAACGSDCPATMAIPDGLEMAVTQLVSDAPQLGTPLLAALRSNGLPAIRGHALLPSWTDQSTLAAELFKLLAATFDAGSDERLRGLRQEQLSAGAGLWPTAAPEACQFATAEWQALLCFRIGVPVFAPAAIFSGCHGPLDPFGRSCPLLPG